MTVGMQETVIGGLKNTIAKCTAVRQCQPGSLQSHASPNASANHVFTSKANKYICTAKVRKTPLDCNQTEFCRQLCLVGTNLENQPLKTCQKRIPERLQVIISLLNCVQPTLKERPVGTDYLESHWNTFLCERASIQSC